MTALDYTSKPIDDLTQDDLDVFPVWEFALDEEGIEGHDETWVRPLQVATIPLNTYSLSVAADFLSPGGRTFGGFVEVTTAMPDPFPSAVILYRGKYLYLEGEPGSRERRRLAREMEGSEEELFPLTYTLRVLVDGEPTYRVGQIE